MGAWLCTVTALRHAPPHSHPHLECPEFQCALGGVPRAEERRADRTHPHVLTHLVFRLLVWPSLPLLFTVGLFLGAPFRLPITEGLFACLRTFFKFENRTSLVVQWLRIHLPMEGTRVQSLVQQDSTYCGATEPVSYNY